MTANQDGPIYEAVLLEGEISPNPYIYNYIYTYIAVFLNKKVTANPFVW